MGQNRGPRRHSELKGEGRTRRGCPCLPPSLNKTLTQRPCPNKGFRAVPRLAPSAGLTHLLDSRAHTVHFLHATQDGKQSSSFASPSQQPVSKGRLLPERANGAGATCEPGRDPDSHHTENHSSFLEVSRVLQRHSPKSRKKAQQPLTNAPHG